MTVRLRVSKDIRRLAYWIATAILWRDSRPRSMYSRQRMAPPVFVDEYMYVRWLKTALSVTENSPVGDRHRDSYFPAQTRFVVPPPQIIQPCLSAFDVQLYIACFSTSTL